MIIDMTHLITQDMPVFPGTEKPVLKTANTIKKDGFKETVLSIFSHTGTHMDAPAHIIEGRKNLDEFQISHFWGKAVVLNFREKKSGDKINLDEILIYEDKINSVDYIIINTGWDSYWGTEKYYDGFPVLTNEAAEYLSSRAIKGIGLDTISLDSMEDLFLTNHRIILSKDMVIIENLTNLEAFGEELFTAYFMPLKFEESDGAPIRAFGIV